MIIGLKSSYFIEKQRFDIENGHSDYCNKQDNKLPLWDRIECSIISYIHGYFTVFSRF